MQWWNVDIWKRTHWNSMIDPTHLALLYSIDSLIYLCVIFAHHHVFTLHPVFFSRIIIYSCMLIYLLFDYKLMKIWIWVSLFGKCGTLASQVTNYDYMFVEMVIKMNLLRLSLSFFIYLLLLVFFFFGCNNQFLFFTYFYCKRSNCCGYVLII